MFLIETYEVLDSIFYDKGTLGSKNTKWFNSQTSLLTVTTDEYGTLLEPTGAVNYSPNATNNSSAFCFNGSFVVEFDMIQSGGQFRWRTSLNNSYTDFLVPIRGYDDNTHIKMEYDGEKVVTFVDGVKRSLRNYTNESNIALSFRLDATDNPVKYKNFVVYSA